MHFPPPGSAVDEEQVWECRIPQYPSESRNEARHGFGVDVGVTRLVGGHDSQLLLKLLVACDRRVIHTQGRRAEETEHVQILGSVSQVTEIGTPRPFDVENQIESVDEDAGLQHVVDRKERTVTEVSHRSTHTRRLCQFSGSVDRGP